MSQNLSIFLSCGIIYAKREENPPNVPQLRNIERFWAHLKTNVYSEGWTAGSVEQLIKKIKRQIKKLPESYLQSLLSCTKTEMLIAADNRPLPVIKSTKIIHLLLS